MEEASRDRDKIRMLLIVTALISENNNEYNGWNKGLL